MYFKDRSEAGQRLAEKLTKYLRRKDAIVLALPRGGILIGAEIAKTLKIALDVIITRKIGAPGNPEFAIGALSENGEVVFSDTTLTAYGINNAYIKKKIEQEKEEIKNRIALYRNGKPLPSLKNKVVILVDDGIATGFTMQIAIQAVAKENPKKIVVAVPAAPISATNEFLKLVTDFVCLDRPPDFSAVGQFYENFEIPKTEKLQELLKTYRK